VARKDKEFLDEVQSGLSLHAAGSPARDPITGLEIKPAGDVQLACDPYRVWAGGSAAAVPPPGWTDEAAATAGAEEKQVGDPAAAAAAAVAETGADVREEQEHEHEEEEEAEEGEEGDPIVASKRRGQDAMEAFDHFSLWELRCVKASAEPRFLLRITGM
jgi:hypothetical protein